MTGPRLIVALALIGAIARRKVVLRALSRRTGTWVGLSSR